MSFNFGLLKEAIKQQKLAHFLLFHGSGSEERKNAALEIALLLNCAANSACGKCPACKKILSGNHPDIHIIEPLDTKIGIDQVLQLQEKICRRVYEGRYRVCFFDEAQKLTLPAANALLKIAEEPSPQTIIILSTKNPEGLIPTLRSRAQMVFFPSPSPKGEEGEAFRLGAGDPDWSRKIEEFGVEKITEMIKTYLKMLETGDFLKTFELFSDLDREEALLFLQVLAVKMKEKIVEQSLSPFFLKEIGKTVEIIHKQVNHRLALEVLACKHLFFGGN
ncbi:MAG: DNA polymerase III subunit delta' [Desulfitobacteriia bacterium]|jgi:DNA polymerase-3 subunit delta'